MFNKKKRIIPLPIPIETNTPKVLLLVDWQNVFLNLFSTFGMPPPGKMNLEERFKKLMAWIKTDIGDILGEHGFVFTSTHFLSSHQKMWGESNLKIVICPKREVKDKIGTKEEDTVDDTIIWFAMAMANHPNIKFICLVSGDGDYVPMLEEVKKKGIKVALAAPTVRSLSRALFRLTDEHPQNGKKMFLRLDQD